MKKIFKSLLMLALALTITSCSTPEANAPSKDTPTINKNNTYNPENYVHKSISELGNPRIAGSSYYDDNIMYYTSTSSTISYLLDNNDILVDTYISFEKLAFPSWFSLTFRASGADRTNASALTQKGYAFMIRPSGEVRVTKNGASFTSANTNSFVTNRKYDIQIGAICEDTTNIRILLIVDGNVVIDVLDTENALLSGGSWFNICSDGSVKAKLYSKKKNYIPEYEHYTLSTLGSYPSTNGADPIPEIDEFNNISLISSSQSVGFYEALQNFSLEFKINYSELSAGCNFWMSTRSQKFDRASSVKTGYKYRFGSGGAVEIYKLGTGGGKLCGGSFKPVVNTDYIYEIGVVDIDETKTFVYISINNQVIASAYDEVNPYQNRGWINMNCDGKMACTLKSSNTRLLPIKNTVEDKTDSLEVKVFFLNTFLKKNTMYPQMSSRNLESIIINGYNVLELNNMYYSLVDDKQVRMVDVKVINNILIININKVIYDKLTNMPIDFVVDNIEITKTNSDSGLKSDKNFFLAQTYLIRI